MYDKGSHPCDICGRAMTDCYECPFDDLCGNTACYTHDCMFEYEGMCRIGVSKRCKACSEYVDEDADEEEDEESEEEVQV